MERPDTQARPESGREADRAAGGEILPTHINHNEEERYCILFSALVHFRLVAPPLQQGVVGPYMVWGVWFTSHLLLDGTGRI
jgi:hypothetical protein